MTKPRVHVLSCAMALALSAVLAGCGSSSSSSPPSSTTSASPTSSTAAAAPAAGGHPALVTVAISNYAFHPVSLAVAHGTRIKFVNDDSAPHTATTNSMGFDSGTLKHGQSATVSLTKPGSYAYICQFHAFMHGTVTVS